MNHVDLIKEARKRLEEISPDVDALRLSLAVLEKVEAKLEKLDKRKKEVKSLVDQLCLNSIGTRNRRNSRPPNSRFYVIDAMIKDGVSRRTIAKWFGATPYWVSKIVKNGNVR